MSYTNSELVRHHLATSFPVQSQITDQAVLMVGDQYQPFFGGAVDKDSVVIKSIQSNELTRLLVTLAGPATPLPVTTVARGSLVVASDSSLGRVYVENCDYVFDYATGELIIKEGGALTAGQQVTVWYLACFQYATGSDYQVDADRGRIRRLVSGDIVSGETVYIDYTPVFAQHTEEMVANAVAEANNLVEREVDPDRQFGADPLLQTAATCRALDIVCRSAAARELSSYANADKTATGWMKLADYYAERTDRLLASFRPPAATPSPPTRS